MCSVISFQGSDSVTSDSAAVTGGQRLEVVPMRVLTSRPTRRYPPTANISPGSLSPGEVNEGVGCRSVTILFAPDPPPHSRAARIVCHVTSVKFCVDFGWCWPFLVFCLPLPSVQVHHQAIAVMTSKWQFICLRIFMCFDEMHSELWMERFLNSLKTGL